MATDRPRGSSIFSGVVLITVGVLFLLRNYRGFELHGLLRHWWPLILIIWGVIKLYERTVGGRSAPGAARVTTSEVFLVLALLALMGVFIALDTVKNKFPDANIEFGDFGRNSFDYPLEVSPTPVPPNARIVVRGGHGDINVRAADVPEIRISGKKSIRSWNEADAAQTASHISVQLDRNGDAYEIHPAGPDNGDSRVDMDIVVPSKALLTVRNKKGDISVSDISGSVTINNQNGNVEVRDNGGDVDIDMRHGDVKVSDTKGDVKLSGKGGEVEVVTATGGLTVDGEFYGPIRADKIAKGVRYVSQRSDLTLTQLSGHLELGSGNLEITDAPGNLLLRTNRYDVNVENAGGKVKIDNRDGAVELRFSSVPKEDIEITNANANISVSLPDSANFDISADCHSCDIDSDFSSGTLSKTSGGSGDSHFLGKYGNNRGPKITLKTSYGSISLRKTSGSSLAPHIPNVPQVPKVPRPKLTIPSPDIPDPSEN